MPKITKPIQVSLNVKAIEELIEKEFRINITWFNEEIGVASGYWWNILDGKKPTSSYKAIVGLIALCERKGWDYRNYIFFNNKC